MATYDKVMKKVDESWRMALIFGIVGIIVFYLVYTFVDNAMTHGISKRGDVYQVDLKSMSTFSLDQDSGATDDIPRFYRDLDGKRVQLVGEMWAPNNAAGPLRDFQLVYSITKCCFNGPPLIQHFVKAKVQNGHEVEFHYGPVNVVGTLHVGVIQKEGHIESVYRVDVESVDPT